MISVSGFREKIQEFEKMHKITNNSIQNRGSNLILNKSGRGPPKKHPHLICNKSVHRFKRRSIWVKQRLLIQRVNIGTE